jgi:outer membrane protein
VNARTALVTARHDHVVASYNFLAAQGRLLPRVLRLTRTTYDPTVHYQQVRDAWTPAGRPVDFKPFGSFDTLTPRQRRAVEREN